MSKYLDSDGLIYVWSKIKALLNTKVDKVTGKGLSTNDYTTTEKNKLSGIEAQANKYVLPKATTSALGGVIVGDNLTVDSSGKISAIQGSYTLPTASASTLGGVKVGTNLSINSSGVLSATDTTYTNATTSKAGLMSASDKAKLDGIDITGIYKYKGSVATVSALPTNASVGDVYNVEADGMNYAWTGTEWDALGSSFSIQSITNAEIDEICV